MLSHILFAEPIGQSWIQLSELALAFFLSALIGLEREMRQKTISSYVRPSNRYRTDDTGVRYPTHGFRVAYSL